MPRPDIKKIIEIVDGVLKLPVWQESFMLKRAHSKLLLRFCEFKNRQSESKAKAKIVSERVSVFVEVYQNNLGIVTLSKIVTTLGDSAFGKNVYSSYRMAKISAESQQRTQKFMAFVEIMVLPDKIIPDEQAPGLVKLTEGSILISNIKGAWFRDCYYRFDLGKKLFVRS